MPPLDDLCLFRREPSNIRGSLLLASPRSGRLESGSLTRVNLRRKRIKSDLLALDVQNALS